MASCIGADQLHTVGFEDRPIPGQLHGQVESGLASECRQDRVRAALALDDLGKDGVVEGLEVGRVGEIRDRS